MPLINLYIFSPIYPISSVKVIQSVQMHIGCNYKKMSHFYSTATEPSAHAAVGSTEVLVTRNFSFPLLLQNFPAFISNFQHLFPEYTLIFSAVCIKRRGNERQRKKKKPVRSVKQTQCNLTEEGWGRGSPVLQVAFCSKHCEIPDKSSFELVSVIWPIV